MDTLVETRRTDVKYETDEPVLYRVDGPVAWVTLNRPGFRNAQNMQMLYALDDAFKRAVADDVVKVIVLNGAGDHFSAGHDIGTPGSDPYEPFDKRVLWYGHANKPEAEMLYSLEQDAYLGMCRRWREIAKPTIASVQGACVAGGLMLAWVCDFIIAAEDAFFQDPVVRMGVPGVEYFAHAFEMHPRIAKEFLMMGERMYAPRAYELGMVNRCVPRAKLDETVSAYAARLAEMPRLALALTKQAVNLVEDLRGKRAANDAQFHMHHFAHAQNGLVSGHPIAGLDAKAMAKTNKLKTAE
jgi:enoyl-CoA hydratase